MPKWPAMSLAFMSAVICVAGDYGIQSRAAGLAPGEMSLRAYGTTIRSRISRMQDGEAPEDNMAASKSFFGDTQGTSPAPQEAVSPAVRVNKGLGGGSKGTCVRRGTILDCN